jgi:hypothetical protein
MHDRINDEEQHIEPDFWHAARRPRRRYAPYLRAIAIIGALLLAYAVTATLWA